MLMVGNTKMNLTQSVSLQGWLSGTGQAGRQISDCPRVALLRLHWRRWLQQGFQAGLGFSQWEKHEFGNQTGLGPSPKSTTSKLCNFR